MKKIQNLWSKISKKITAKKKTLNSLQKVAIVLDDVDHLNGDLKQFMVKNSLLH